MNPMNSSQFPPQRFGNPRGEQQGLIPNIARTSVATDAAPDSTWKPLAWWLHLTSSGWQNAPRNFAESERARRSRLASYLFLGLFLAGLIFLTAGASDVPTLLAIVGTMLGVVVACVLNRLGFVSAAGLIVSFLLIIAVFGADLSAPGGLLGPDYLPSYDILVLAVVVAGSLLTPAAAFYFAIINSAAIAADFLWLQPHTTDLTNEINQDGLGLLLGRPIGLEIAVAVVAYLWVSGTIRAAKRADQAERVAELEHAYAVQRQQLEIGVQQILETHVRLANGDFSPRAPLTQDNALWQISISLNNLMGRFQKVGQADYQLQRTNEEISRLASALVDLQAGRRPIWPAPSGTEVDQLLAILANRRPQNNPSSSQAGSGWGGVGYPQANTGVLPGSNPGTPPSGIPRPGPFRQSGPTRRPGYSGPSGPPGTAGGRPDSQPSRSLPPFGRPESNPGNPGGFPGMPDNGWPSLTPSGDENAWSSAPQGETGGSSPAGTSLPPFDNPWYLPPEE